MTIRTLRSRDNPRFRAVVELTRSAKARRGSGRTVLEGIHLCAAWAQHCGQPAAIVTTEAALADPQVAALVPPDHPDVLLLAGNLFSELSQVENGIGLAYVVAQPAPPLPARVADDTVFLDRLQDPGNVGTVLRSCAAAGIPRVITAPHTVGCWSPKVLRAGMGAHFVLDLHEGVTWALLAARLAVPGVGTSGHAGRSLYEQDLRGPRLWVFGNEGAGLDPAIAPEVADVSGGVPGKDRLPGRVEAPAAAAGPSVHLIAIPQAPGVESLNVAMAATVCLFEQRRQRLAEVRNERPPD